MSLIRDKHKLERKQRVQDENYNIPIWKTGMRPMVRKRAPGVGFIPSEPPIVTAQQSRPRAVKEQGNPVPVKIIRVPIRPPNEIMNFRLGLDDA
jgi:hypothetical protein